MPGGEERDPSRKKPAEALERWLAAREGKLGIDVAHAAEGAIGDLRAQLDAFFADKEGSDVKAEVADLVSRARRHVKNLGAPGPSNIRAIRLDNAVEEFTQIEPILRNVGERFRRILEVSLEKVYGEHLSHVPPGSPPEQVVRSHMEMITAQMKAVLTHEIDSRIFAGTGASGFDELAEELTNEMGKAVRSPTATGNDKEADS